MDFQLPSILLFIFSFLSLSLSVYSFIRLRSSTAVVFSLLSLAFFVYTAAYAMELASLRLESIRFWIMIEYLGIPVIGPLWLILTIHFSGKKRLLSKSITAALFVVPLLTIAMNWTNEWHHLYYTILDIDPMNPMKRTVTEKGPFYWAYQSYHILCYCTGVYFLLKMYLKAAPAFRKQAFTLLAVSIFPFIGHIAYLFGKSPWRLDFTPFLLFLAYPAFVVGLRKFKLIEILPVAKERIFETMADGILVVDAAKRIVDFNAAAGRMLGIDTAIIGSDASAALEGHPWILGILSSSMESGGVFSEGKLNLEIGIERLKLEKSGYSGWLISLHDITKRLQVEEELKRSQEELERLASTDEMTGAVNRRTGLLILEKQMLLCARKASPLSICYFDIDGLKLLNDTYGHALGDELIKATYDLISRSLRRSDTVARLGGDEFIAILPECPEEENKSILARIEADIAEENLKGERPYKIRISYGCAVYSGEEGMDASKLIRIADARMYEMKKGA